MADLSLEFRRALEPLLAALASHVGGRPLEPRLDPGHAVRLEGEGVTVPTRYEVHWRRFGTIPTDLLRDVAFAARRAQRVKGEDEADWLVFAEAFVRDELLSHD